MKPFGILALGLLFFASCKPVKQTVQSNISTPEMQRIMPEQKPYHESRTRLNDIIHQELRVSFDWEKKYLFGEATIKVKPYFYPVKELILNARGMEIHELAILKNINKFNLQYKYENDSLTIFLDRNYARGEEYTLYINYTAKPDELKETGGSAAITSDKGLYFINADGKEPGKPKQIWTQCETQAASVWFPTIDAPNERFTQEIYITVDTSFVTLSNGLLVSSVINEREGMRTDYWRQSLPSAPYLTMMAIGKFRIVKDRWRNLEVNYYVEPEYEKYGRAIFGNTPEMMDFFSKLLGVDYPWEKYSQVVVRDYVSGAMENTSASLFGEFMQRDARALLDATNEDVISHELFHQWFGDLVTCESWSNITLNESFATYGEYLWNEYKYGREEADYGAMKDLEGYLQQSKTKNENLVRFHYDSQEDVFDAISYQKGGRILHMLRKILGDDAFFSGLNLYLNENKLRPAEAHHLRLAMEEVSGTDLNWFFNQWYFDKGHPDLEVSYEWIDSLKTQAVVIEQKQDFEKFPLFRLPLIIDIYKPSGVESHQVVCRNKRETFLFSSDQKPLLVNVDAEKMLVCTKKDNKTNEEWIYQYQHAPLFLDRHEALQKIAKNYKTGTPSAGLVMQALEDSMWAIRNYAIKNSGTLARGESTKTELMNKLIDLSKNDPKAAVRESALAALNKNYDSPELTNVYMEAVNDSSYEVMERAISNIAGKDKDRGLSIAKSFESVNNKRIREIVYQIYSEYGSDENHSFMETVLSQFSGGGKYQTTLSYANFLKRCSPSTIETGILNLEEIAKNGNPWFVRLAGIQGLSELSKYCDKMADESSTDHALQEKYHHIKDQVEKKVAAIKASEKDKNLLKIYGSLDSSGE